MPAQDKKSEATGPASDDTFSFTRDDGTVIELPSLATIDPDMDAIEAIREDLTSSNQLLAMTANRRFLMTAFPEPYSSALQGISRMKEFQRLMSEWSEFSGVGLGE